MRPKPVPSDWVLYVSAAPDRGRLSLGASDAQGKDLGRTPGLEETDGLTSPPRDCRSGYHVTDPSPRDYDNFLMHEQIIAPNSLNSRRCSSLSEPHQFGISRISDIPSITCSRHERAIALSVSVKSKFDLQSVPIHYQKLAGTSAAAGAKH